MRKRIKCCFLYFCIYLLICTASLPILAQETIKLQARSAILMDYETGRVLWEKECREIRAMASTTKIMTCIVALENGNLQDKVKVSKKAASAPRVKLYIKSDEEYRLEDLLYALMLKSSNDAAVAIAEHIGGSVEKFCEMMTQKAFDIGAVNTCYKTPNGLDSDGHQSTAYDLAKIACYALNNPKFMQIIRAKEYQILSSNGNSRDMHLSNANLFLSSYSGALGIKTGYTGQAGYCFVGAAERDGMRLVSVVLGSGWPPHKTYKWTDTQKLMDYGFKNFKLEELVVKGTLHKSIPVEKGKQDEVMTYIGNGFSYPLSSFDKVEMKYEVPDMIKAPVESNVTIGYLCIYINGESIRNIPIKTLKKIEKKDFKYYFRYLIYNWLSISEVTI